MSTEAVFWMCASSFFFGYGAANFVRLMGLIGDYYKAVRATRKR